MINISLKVICIKHDNINFGMKKTVQKYKTLNAHKVFVKMF